MGKLFGTDGVRGIANTTLTPYLAFQLGRAGAEVLTASLHERPTILVGKDTRISGDMLECALVAGICSTGAQAITLGVLPTPAIAYLIKKHNADAGIVISASHNSFEYNGIKFFSKKGYKLSDELEGEIERKILADSDNITPMPMGADVGRLIKNCDGEDDYINYVSSIFNCRLTDMKLIIDCANGANYKLAKKVYEKLGACVECIGCEPNGININDGCGSTHMDALNERVKAGGYDIGIAFDGDGDRMLAIDEKGKRLTGDEIMLIIGKYMKENGVLTNNMITATTMSNLGFFIAAQELGIDVIKTDVGDKYVLEGMLKNECVLGGEESGHIISLAHNTTGDGIVSGLLLLEVMKKTGKPLSELRKIVTILPQVLVNARVKNEKKNFLMESKKLSDEIKKVESKLSGQGRVLIRPSGTEPVVRVMIEGKDQKFINEKAHELASLIETLAD